MPPRARTPAEPATPGEPAPVDEPQPAPVVEIPTVEALPSEAAAPGRYELVHPYPVTVAELGREVHPGDVLDWPAGPPNTAQWLPTEAPVTPAREG